MDQELRTYRKWQPLLLGLCAALGMWAGLKVRQPETRNADPSDRPAMAYDQAQKIQDVVSYVQSKYVDSLDNGQATDLALQSYLSA
ncbi:MAG TPA: hypothetical protein VFX48_04240, partial [Saprospiraceae bacterium]|nr:hypothetical protein [Saprospiraceae bacterium]